MTVDAGLMDTSAPVLDANEVHDASMKAAVDAALAYRRPGFCERPGQDAVRDLFCGEQAPAIGDLGDLLVAVGVHGSIQDTGDAAMEVDPNTVLDMAVFTAHSTALSGQLVSPINPRAILIGSSTVMTFQRGVQQVELASFARDQALFNFYLLQFEQACNQRAGGCKPGDLYTPRIEREWQRISIRDAEELKNTSFDCRQCHQRGRETPMLLMRELEAPWTHFFELLNTAYVPGALPGVRGRDLVEDYERAKGREPYAGIGARTMRHTFGLVLQNIVDRQQPVLFDAPRIEEERWPIAEDGSYPSVPQPSPTWEGAYEAFKRGEQLALPYFEPRPTDPKKQAKLSEAYQRFLSGELPADELPDLSDIFPDDPLLRAKIGLQTEPGATPAQTLVQGCGSCHNDVLDQTITRARFNIDLARMSRQEIDLAIERISRVRTDPGAMPPSEARQLDPAARDALIQYLRTNQRGAQDDALLSHAARMGMTGGAKP